MPLPLPWFDNQVDPLLPTDIKPLLYFHDQYQTYDLIKWDKVTNFWQNVILPFDFFSIVTSGIVLIERFTPWSYPWCDNYSTKLYNFIEQYSGTDYYRAAIFSQPTTITAYSSLASVPSFGDERVNIPKANYLSSETLNFIIPQTPNRQETVVLTWLADSQESTNAKCFNKQYKVLYSSISSNQETTITLANFLLCSLVISCEDTSLIANIKSQLNAQGLLYENLNSIFLELETAIQSAFPRMNKIVKDYSFRATEATIDYDRALVLYGYSGKVEFHSMSFMDRPDYYRSACLLYANNNAWNNGQTHDDLGNLPIYYGIPDTLENQLKDVENHLFPPYPGFFFKGWDCNGINGLQPRQSLFTGSAPFSDAYCKFHYFSSEDGIFEVASAIMLAAKGKVRLSNDEVIQRMDIFLYQSSIEGEFDNA